MLAILLQYTLKLKSADWQIRLRLVFYSNDRFLNAQRIYPSFHPKAFYPWCLCKFAMKLFGLVYVVSRFKQCFFALHCNYVVGKWYSSRLDYISALTETQSPVTSTVHHTVIIVIMWLSHNAAYLQYRHSTSVYNGLNTRNSWGTFFLKKIVYNNGPRSTEARSIEVWLHAVSQSQWRDCRSNVITLPVENCFTIS
jgi:hypothetical protein